MYNKALGHSDPRAFYLREKTGSEFIQILPAAVYHVYRMSTKMGKENNWGQEMEGE